MTQLHLPNVYVTGMGMISGIGNTISETFRSLMDKKSGIGKLKYLDTIHKEKFPVSEVPFSNPELCEMLGFDPQKEYPRTTLLACIAAKQAMEDAKFKPEDTIRTGLIFGTTVGGMDLSEKYYRNPGSHMDYVINGQNKGYTVELLADTYRINDFVTTLTTACSSSANAITLGADLIKTNVLDRVVVGGADALCKFTVNGFNTLMILSEDKCKPFDKNRNGLNLGEGAGFLVLESEKLVRANNKKIYAKVSGYSNKNDAYHQTATSENGEGPYLCMTEALTSARLTPKEIDYINAHGTGTPNNDITESIAIHRVFGDQYPPFASLKPYIGHTLGAAGVVEAIVSIVCLNKQMIFGGINYHNPIEEVAVYPEKETQEASVLNVMSNAFGFGGNDTSIIFSLPKPS